MTEIAPGAPRATDRGVARALKILRDPRTIRDRAGDVLERAEAGESRHFRVCSEHLDDVARFVATLTRDRYPTLDVPLHSRWRHFLIQGRDRGEEVLARIGTEAPRARLHAAIDLVVVSVLLDAGAGPSWQYRCPVTGAILSRSEGLAAASLNAFEAGLFSDDPKTPTRVDARRLCGIGETDVAAMFQVSTANPLEGLAGRARLLNALGECLIAHSAIFGEQAPRPGRLADNLVSDGKGNATAVNARDLLARILVGFAEIWPGRHHLAGYNLGDVWPLAGMGGPEPLEQLMPFHKLSQWLTYSLVEPLQAFGATVTSTDDLTGLAEYRNGGLFLDMDVLLPIEADALSRVWEPGDDFVVEWRALTVALLDRLAPRVRLCLGPDAETLSLGAILEGGTWAAGRELARRARADGGPPFAIHSDGTLF